MRLSPFIRSELDPILAEWDRFARSNAPTGPVLTDHALRDHAKEMLLAIAEDIETPQSPKQQALKSQGAGTDADGRSAAATHGLQRYRHDFSLVQLGAEFRALRSTVLRLWLPRVDAMSEDTVLEVIRFNEAIDQAVAESMVAYAAATTDARNLLLAVLGHDLRSPLATMSMAGTLLAHADTPADDRANLAQTVQRSARLMTRMVEDLLGFTRIQLGKGLPVHRAWSDVAQVLEAAAADARATHPHMRYELRARGELVACYDRTRLHQLFMNLLVNAAQHGTRTHPVTVDASATEAQVCVRITNHGVIPEAALKSIFKPLVQLADGCAPSPDARLDTSLGLGLFIAREIAESHHGTVDVRSNAMEGTTFTVTLPRDLSCQAA